MSSAKRLPKKTRTRVARDEAQFLNTKFAMQRIEPITQTQEKTFEFYENGKNLLLVGSAGTGKTYVALYLMLRDILDIRLDYKELIILRSTVQTRDQGFMPGDAKEKLSHYEQPYIDIVTNLFERGDAYQILKQKGMLKFMSTSFIRGLTFDDALILVDECQNMNYSELRSVATRAGERSRMIFCGDAKQDDLRSNKNKVDTSGLRQFKSVLERMEDPPGVIQFTRDDIVRSGFVKNYIVAEEELEVA